MSPYAMSSTNQSWKKQPNSRTATSHQHQAQASRPISRACSLEMIPQHYDSSPRGIIYVQYKKLSRMRNISKQSQKRNKPTTAQQVKQERTEQPANRYDEMSLYYSNEKFNEKIHNSIKAIALHAYSKNDFAYIKKYPICKILTFLAKKLFLNGLELIFLEYILEENNWRIDDEVITRNYQQVKDFMNNTDVNDQKEYLCMLFYLTLISYSAKYFLNEPQDMAIFEEELNNMINNFQTHFKDWSRNNSAITSKISPKILNKIFRQLSNREPKTSYFLMVESIIDISPPYNNSQNQRKQRKKPTAARETDNHSSQMAPPPQQLLTHEQDEEDINRLSRHGLPMFQPGQSFNDDDTFPNLLIQRQNTSVNDGLESVIDKKMQERDPQ